MRRLATLLLLIGACVTTTGAHKDREVDVVGRAFYNTVILEDNRGNTFCSGIIVNHIVITAWHCLEDGHQTFVQTRDSRWEAALLGKMPGSDLAALVPVDTRIQLPKGARLAKKAPGYGDDIWLVGHPLGEFTHTITKGIVSNPFRPNGLFGGHWMQHDAGQTTGNSGGPVLNKRGRLVGIVSFGVIQQVRCPMGCLAFQDSHISGAVHHGKVREFILSL
jgi:S1-C subfamily serine protease